MPEKTKPKHIHQHDDMMLLDEKRLKVIRKRIAEGYYDRKNIRRSIAQRVMNRLLNESKRSFTR